MEKDTKDKTGRLRSPRDQPFALLFNIPPISPVNTMNQPSQKHNIHLGKDYSTHSISSSTTAPGHHHQHRWFVRSFGRSMMKRRLVVELKQAKPLRPHDCPRPQSSSYSLHVYTYRCIKQVSQPASPAVSPSPRTVHSFFLSSCSTCQLPDWMDAASAVVAAADDGSGATYKEICRDSDSSPLPTTVRGASPIGGVCGSGE